MERQGTVIVHSINCFTLCCACSLLDILADRKSKSMISGTVLIDGKNKPPNFKCLVGYVVQVSTH